MKRVKVGDVFHMRCDWATGGLQEGIIEILERSYGKAKYQVIKGISQMKTGDTGEGLMYSFFSGRVWESTKMSKRKSPEYWL